MYNVNVPPFDLLICWLIRYLPKLSNLSRNASQIFCDYLALNLPEFSLNLKALSHQHNTKYSIPHILAVATNRNLYKYIYFCFSHIIIKYMG